MFNRPLRTRLDLIRPNIQSTVAQKQEKQIINAKGTIVTRQLAVGQCVLARDYRGKDKWVECTVVKQLGPVTYIVQLDSGLTWKRHIDQLVGLQSGSKNLMDHNRSYELVTSTSAVPTSSMTSTVEPHHQHSPPSHSPTPRHSPTQRQSERPSPPVTVANRQSLQPPPAQLIVTSPITTNTRRYPIRDRKPPQKLDL